MVSKEFVPRRLRFLPLTWPKTSMTLPCAGFKGAGHKATQRIFGISAAAMLLRVTASISRLLDECALSEADDFSLVLSIIGHS